MNQEEREEISANYSWIPLFQNIEKDVVAKENERAGEQLSLFTVEPLRPSK
jgi:hypothetical protein